jgi:aspartate/methionine/tyrosine aminotransferase
LNKLSALLDERRAHGKTIIDLTISNPTECGISYPEREILSALSNQKSLHYQPDPRGLLSAREAISEYYRGKRVDISPSNIFLAASTSEAYSLVFKLLCNANESVLVPQPSYPLFEYLAQINDVQLRHYNLMYDYGWHIDFNSLNQEIVERLKAIVLVNPHNPTGMFLKKEEYDRICEFAKRYNLALIVDEVFIDYPFEEDSYRLGSTAGESEVLTFTLNGISKMVGLPQMKLGWCVVSGRSSVVNEATERLEILCDTFLSVNTPVQIALPELFKVGRLVQASVLQRLKSNYQFLHHSMPNALCSPLFAEGGWYAILKVPNTKSDEEWAMELLEQQGVYLFPGYYFDFEENRFLIVSLITPQEIFSEGIDYLMKSLFG